MGSIWPAIGHIKTLCCVIVVSATVGCYETGCDEFNPPIPPNKSPSREAHLGAPTQQTIVHQLVQDGDRGFYFRGYYNGQYVVGRLNTDGQVLWTDVTDDEATDIVRVDISDGPAAGAILVIGAPDNFAIEPRPQSVVSLFDREGALIDELAVVTSESEIWLGAVTTASVASEQCEYFVVGGSGAIENVVPIVVRLRVDREGNLSKRDEKTFSDGAGQFVFFLCAAEPDRDGLFTVGLGRQSFCVVSRISESLDIEWTTDLESHIQDDHLLWSEPHKIRLANDDLFVVGEVRLTYFEPESNWRDDIDPLMASVSVNDGTVNWINWHTLSEGEDGYWDCWVTDSGWYAAGGASRFIHVNTNREFGCGLISRVDPRTGSYRRWYFGSESYASEFFSMVVDGTVLYAAGYTNLMFIDHGRQGWFTETSLGASSPSQLSLPSVNREDTVLPPRERRYVRGSQ